MGDRFSPLEEAHRALGARLIDFGGWDMPLQYAGVVSEHNAVRNSVGVFDVSHLGKLRVRGESAGDALQRALTADVTALEQGRAAYSLVLTEEGGCIDDVFAYRISEHEWLVVPNAANVAPVAQAIVDAGAEPEDEWDRYAILAIQGPESFELFDKVWPSSGALDLTLHSWCEIDVFGEPGIVARTGYTGERGFELYAPSGTARDAFAALLDSGATPVGLGARDTLRLEMGYALYGHELALDVNPLEASLGWVLAWDTPFRGRDALEAIRGEGPDRKLIGITCTEAGIPRQGYAVLSGETPIGEVTSGNFSPTLKVGIALAFVAAADTPAPGDSVFVDARGRLIPGDIVRPPFIRKTD